MGDARRGQRVAIEQSSVPIPVHPGALTPPPEAAEPDSAHLLLEGVQGFEVTRQAVILVVAAQHAADPTMLISHWRMQPTTRVNPDLLELPG